MSRDLEKLECKDPACETGRRNLVPAGALRLLQSLPQPLQHEPFLNERQAETPEQQRCQCVWITLPRPRVRFENELTEIRTPSCSHPAQSLLHELRPLAQFRSHCCLRPSLQNDVPVMFDQPSRVELVVVDIEWPHCSEENVLVEIAVEKFLGCIDVFAEDAEASR